MEKAKPNVNFDKFQEQVLENIFGSLSIPIEVLKLRFDQTGKSLSGKGKLISLSSSISLKSKIYNLYLKNYLKEL